MALKDLPGSTVLDFKILLDSLDAYIKAFALTSAGKEPPERRVENRSRGGRLLSVGTTRSLLTIQAPGTTQLTASMTAIYNTLKGSITVTASDRATLTATGVSTKEGWDNGFFIIRTQVLGAGDAAVIAQLDEFWTRLQAVKGRWNIIGAKGTK